MSSTDSSTSAHPPQPGPSTYTRAPKGKACLNCRRRKLKCDCARPVCSQCTRYGREKDCEYSDKDQRSRTEILEENIAALQARLKELEHPESSPTPSVRLSHPASWNGLPEELQDVYTTGRSSGSPDIVTAAEPSYLEAQALIEAFLPYSTDVGFFLNPTRFLSWASQRLPTLTSIVQPYSSSSWDGNDPLLSVVYLWGSLLTNDEDIRARSSSFLDNATRHISAARLASNGFARPDVIHIIQAEVLLANYLFNAGLFAEGRQHVASAVSLALTYELHKTRSPRVTDASHMRLVPSADGDASLPPSLDVIEEGERICAFWQVYVMDKTWSIVLGRPSLLMETANSSTFIDTPWPLAMEQYGEGALPQGYGLGGRTVQRFMQDLETGRVGSRVSSLALKAQAAALLDRAAWLSSASAADPSIREYHSANVETAEALINQFIVLLGSMQTPPSRHSSDWVRALAVTHCIARLASMMLHFADMETSLKSATKAMSAAKAIIASVATVPAANMTQVDPLLPIFLTSSAQVIIADLVRAQSPLPYKRQIVCCTNPYYLAQTMAEVTALMSVMNSNSRLTVLQLEAVQGFRSALAGTEFG